MKPVRIRGAERPVAVPPLARGHRVALAVALAAALPLTGCGGGDEAPAPPDGTAAERASGVPGAPPDSLTAATDAWHAARLDRLRAPDGWLTLVGLEELPTAGEATAGRDPDAAVVLRGDVPDHVGVFEVSDAGVRFRPAAGVPVQAGDPATPVPAAGVDLADDRGGAPTVLRLGSVSWHVIARGDRRFVRVKDAASAVRREFQGVDRWPADPAWRVTARLRSQAMPPTVPMVDVLGNVTAEPSPGVLEFTLDGRTHRLIPVGQVGQPLFIVFADATSGHASYGGGRFLSTDAPGPDGTVVLDFNRAVNPPCAFTPYATCPLPPPENVLPVPVTAGEKTWGEKP